MSFPCPTKVTCECSDDPLGNLTAEAYDQRVYMAIVYPTNGPTWRGQCCNYVCESTVSQEAANLCAQNMAQWMNLGGCSPVTKIDGTVECADPTCIPPDPLCTPRCEPESNCERTPAVFWNTEQTCALMCPDGSLFFHVVPANTFSAESQLLADRMAYSFACANAKAKQFCLSPTTNSCCNATAYSQEMSVSGGVAPFTWSLIRGSLPTGLTLSNVTSDWRTVKLDGTPSETALKTLVYQVKDALGHILQATVNVGSVDILPVTLPQATVGTAYSQQLTASGLTAGMSVTFALTSGALPTGMTLSPTGLLSGTPTGGLPASFTIGINQVVVPTPTPEPDKPIDITPSWTNGTVGQAYSLQLAIVGVGGYWTFSLDSGTFPNGLSMTNTGLITGTPTVSGTFPIVIKAVSNTFPSPIYQSFQAKIVGVPGLDYDNPTAYYKLDAAGATAIDTVNNKDLSAYDGTPTSVAGIISNACDLMAGGYTITNSEFATGINDFTLRFWFKTDSLASHVIVGIDDYGQSWYVVFTPNQGCHSKLSRLTGRINFVLAVNWTQVGEVVTRTLRTVSVPFTADNQWHRVVVSSFYNHEYKRIIQSILLDTDETDADNFSYQLLPPTDDPHGAGTTFKLFKRNLTSEQFCDSNADSGDMVTVHSIDEVAFWNGWAMIKDYETAGHGQWCVADWNNGAGKTFL